MRTRKLLFLRTLGCSSSVCLYRYAKKNGKSCCACQKCRLHLYRWIKVDFACKHFNLVPRLWDCSTFNFSLMLLFISVCSVLFWLSSPLPFYYTYIRCYIHFWLHPITQANCIIIWSETGQTGYSMAVTIRIKSALDLVRKIERAKRRHWSEPRNESILKKFWKSSRWVFVSI